MEKEWDIDWGVEKTGTGKTIILIEGLPTQDEAQEIADNVNGNTFYTDKCGWCVWFFPVWSNDYSNATFGILPMHIDGFAPRTHA